MINNPKIPIQSLSFEQLQNWLKKHHFPPFRAKQIRLWIYNKLATKFADFKNLPQNIIDALNQEFTPSSLEITEQLESTDGTLKCLSTLQDGNTIESVLIHADNRHTVCISTQVGCAVRCVFCASGRQGLIRNLTSAEIIDQVLWASHQNHAKITNIVVMGMGEPLHNLENLHIALKTLGDPDGFNLGARHVTISTSGIVPGIRALADIGTPWNLALSLHATSDEQRAKVIPDKNRYPLEDIYAACQYHREKTNRMLTLEYALVAGINDSFATADELAQIAKKLHAKVNLIPCNPAGSTCTAPHMKYCREFLNLLLRKNIQATLRVRKGDDIAAACGQLRQRYCEKKA
ncbi:MAG: 23S rRNA (adenine(2503)-C(2))-methyltransferase RlmN [Lentisphaeria bacterium]